MKFALLNRQSPTITDTERGILQDQKEEDLIIIICHLQAYIVFPVSNSQQANTTRLLLDLMNECYFAVKSNRHLNIRPPEKLQEFVFRSTEQSDGRVRQGSESYVITISKKTDQELREDAELTRNVWDQISDITRQDARKHKALNSNTLNNSAAKRVLLRCKLTQPPQ